LRVEHERNHIDIIFDGEIIIDLRKHDVYQMREDDEIILGIILMLIKILI
jgi:hypothetical protein